MSDSFTRSNFESSKTTSEESLVDYNISLTVEERALNHQRALETVNEIIKAREQIYRELKPSSKATS